MLVISMFGPAMPVSLSASRTMGCSMSVDARDALDLRVPNEHLFERRSMHRDVHVLRDGRRHDKAAVRAVIGRQIGTAASERDAQRAASDDHQCSPLPAAAGHDDEAQRLFGLGRDPVEHAGEPRDAHHRRPDDGQRPQARPRDALALAGQLAHGLREAAHTRDAQREVAVELVPEHAPQAALREHLDDLESRVVAERAQPVRTVAEVVVRLLVQPELERRRQDQDAVILEDAAHLDDERARARSVLEHLHVEHRVEGAIGERQARAVVDQIGFANAARGERRGERRLVLDAQVLRDEGTKMSS